MARLGRKVRAQRPGALLLDGGDTWQGSATALWTRGEDMVEAAKLLGVDIMTGHWEFTLGAKRVQEIIEKDFAGKVDFLAQNVKTADFGDPVFKPYVIREINGLPCAIIGQAFTYTPIAQPRASVAAWPVCNTDRLAAMLGLRPSHSRRRSCSQALSRPHSPRGMTSPVSSAIGMKSIGPVKPLLGCCHRTNASNPTTTPRSRSISGW